MINPPMYERSLEALKETGGPVTSEHRTNVGIFTYGEPYYQLLKVLEMQSKNPDLPISQIWLTREPKGRFIEELLKTGAVGQTELSYTSPEFEDYPGESLSPPSGYPLDKIPHIMVMFDDNPKELQSILKSNEFLSQNSGATFVVVRSRRPGTKAAAREWQVVSPYGEIDFSSKDYTGREISRIFQINRYLELRRLLGEENKRVKSEALALERLGVDLSGLT